MHPNNGLAGSEDGKQQSRLPQPQRPAALAIAGSTHPQEAPVLPARDALAQLQRFAQHDRNHPQESSPPRYVQERLIRQTIYGAIFVGRDNKLNRLVALKVSDLSRLRTAKASGQIREDPVRECRVMQHVKRQQVSLADIVLQ